MREKDRIKRERSYKKEKGRIRKSDRMRDNDRFRENSCMREKNQSLLEKLKKYGESDFYPFHMPGHKRRDIDDDFFDGFPNPYSIDITEIDGFDNLHHAEGILKKSMEEAADIYGADKTYYLVNGSTCGLLAAICGCTDWNGKILLARNCHKAAYHALLLNGLQPEYLYPEFIKEYGINGVIDSEKVRIALEENKSSNGAKITAVLVVSPTYEGVVSDISKNTLDINEVMKAVDITELKNRFPNELSGGQQQRAAIARAIVKNPSILLCDELTGALDSKTSKEVLKFVQKVNAEFGSTVVIITHNQEIRKMADRIIEVKDGKIIRNYMNENKMNVEDIEI